MGRVKSKRVTLATKHHKIKKIKDAKKKMKKFARQNPELVRNLKKKQDAGVPNLYPFKLALIDQTTTERLQERENKSRETTLKKAAKESTKIAAEQQDAALRKDYELMHTAEGRRKWYFKELMKVIEASDVIIQVLDARDPLGCRALDIERRILAQQTKEGRPAKRLIQLLNKVDMIPADNLAQWVTHLRREHPTLAFKSSTQKGRGHLQQIQVNLKKDTNTSSIHSQSSVGASALLQLLKNYARNAGNTKTGLTVGVIGYPNVGKSSVINSLKAQRVAQVSPSAGCTKTLQYIKLDGTITLVDSPGVLFDADYDNDDSSSTIQSQKQGLLLRNALRADQIDDPQEVVKAILNRITHDQLMTIYNVAEFRNHEEFLLFIAHRNGKIGKGGIPNLDDAARIIINDWNFGKIPFHTTPPQLNDIEESKIVTTFSEAFDINKLLNDANDSMVKVFKNGALQNRSQVVGMGDDSEDDDDIDDDDDDDDVDFDEDEFEDMMDDDLMDDGLNSSMVAPVSKSNNSTTTLAAKKPQHVVAQRGGYYQEESSDEEEIDNNTAFKLQQQQAFYQQKNKRTAVPLPQTKAGKSKASTVLSKSYQVEGTQRAMTKGELKKVQKTRERQQTRDTQQNNDEFDWNTLG